MLRLSTPSWLFTSRPEDASVPLCEQACLTPETKQRLDAVVDGAKPPSPFIVLTARLSNHLAHDGQLPDGFSDILRTLLAELGLEAPLALRAFPENGACIEIEHLGASVDSLNELETRLGGRAIAAKALRDIALAVAEHVGGLDPTEFDAVESAVRGKYGIAADAELSPDAARAAAVLIAQLVEARTRETICADVADQVALFVDAIAKKRGAVVFVLEPVTVACVELDAVCLSPVQPAANGSTIVTPTLVEGEAASIEDASEPVVDGVEPAALECAKVDLPLVDIAVVEDEAPVAQAPIVEISGVLTSEPCSDVRGIAYSRDPATGEFGLVCDATQIDLNTSLRLDAAVLKKDHAVLHATLARELARLETEKADVVAVEFARRSGQADSMTPLSADPSSLALLRTLIDLAERGTISRAQVVERLRTLDLSAMRSCGVFDDGVLEPLATGVVASPGAACGRLAFSGPQALAYRRSSCDVILVVDGAAAESTAVLDLAVAQGVLLLGEGRSSRVARATRRLGIPCLAIFDATLDVQTAELTIGSRSMVSHAPSETLVEGAFVTIDTRIAALYVGELPLVELLPPREKAILHAWRIRELSRGRVESRANSVEQ